MHTLFCREKVTSVNHLLGLLDCKLFHKFEFPTVMLKLYFKCSFHVIFSDVTPSLQKLPVPWEKKWGVLRNSQVIM